MGDRVFGCDICQELCPHNEKRQIPTTCQALLPASGVGESLDCQSVLEMGGVDEFLEQVAGTALTRSKLPGLQRNARIVLANLASDMTDS
jgi:epoxyqueuosine reductase